MTFLLFYIDLIVFKSLMVHISLNISYLYFIYLSGKSILSVRQNGLCYFCHESVDITGDTHHLNHIHKDNRITNRSLVHRKCHVTHHKHTVMRKSL